MVEHLKTLILCASGFHHAVSPSKKEKARNLPKVRSPEDRVIYAQTGRNKWCQSGSSSDWPGQLAFGIFS